MEPEAESEAKSEGVSVEKTEAESEGKIDNLDSDE